MTRDGQAPDPASDARGRRIGFIVRNNSRESADLFADLVPWLLGQGHAPILVQEDVVIDRFGATLERPGVQTVSRQEFARTIDLAVVLGGDGTILAASAIIADARVPVLGINLGRLGFLAPFDPQDARQAIAAAAADALSTSERMRLEITYRPESGEPVTHSALNDVVIHQGSMARLIGLQARVDGELVSSYRADGLIISSPSGSTAYNLAAGGPIIMPGHGAMVITPICAHTLTSRPLVVPAESIVTLALDRGSEDVVLTIDGQWGCAFTCRDRVEITAADSPLLVFDSSKRYFDILREKLHWGARTERKARLDTASGAGDAD